MKNFILVLFSLIFIITLAACVQQNTGNATTADEEKTAGDTSGPDTTETTTGAPVLTTAAQTTETAEPSTLVNPAVITGKASAAAKTYTGYEPLPPVAFTVSDPDNSRGLSTKATGFGFGVGKNGAQPAESIKNQDYFDGFGALALDRTSPGKVMHLTFDCGYENGYTGKILDTLKAKNVKAAFFCTLGFIKDEPELTARMIKEGHIVGNHSATHPVFPDISRGQMAKEIQDCDNYLRTNFGYSAAYFRFPTGSYSESSLDLVRSLGFHSVFWSVAYADWDPANQKGTQFAFDTVTSRLHPGAVILLHAVSKDNTAALGSIIDWATAQGYVFEAL